MRPRSLSQGWPDKEVSSSCQKTAFKKKSTIQTIILMTIANGILGFTHAVLWPIVFSAYTSIVSQANKDPDDFNGTGVSSLIHSNLKWV